MSLAEIMFRIAAALGGWLIFLGHALTLLAITRVECDPMSVGHAQGTAVFAVLSALGLALVGVGLPWREGLRWLAYPALGLAAIAAWEIAPVLVETTIDGANLCRSLRPSIGVSGTSGAPGRLATDLERAWPILQLLVLGGGGVQALRVVVPRRSAANSAPVRHRSGDI